VTEPKLLCGAGDGRGRIHGQTLERIPVGPEEDEVMVVALCDKHRLVMVPTAEYLDAVARHRHAVHLTRPTGAYTAPLKPGQFRGWWWIEQALLARRSGKA
jgi:hypothetical protein